MKEIKVLFFTSMQSFYFSFFIRTNLERDKTIENYSISGVAGYLGLDRAHLRILANLVNNRDALSPSEIAAVSSTKSSSLN